MTGPIDAIRGIRAVGRSRWWRARAYIQVAVALGLTPVWLAVCLLILIPLYAIVGACEFFRSLIPEAWRDAWSFSDRALRWMVPGRFTPDEMRRIAASMKRPAATGGPDAR